MQQVLVHVHVLDMAASFLILLLTFKKENGNVTYYQFSIHADYSSLIDT
jgi:hypothetical protein